MGRDLVFDSSDVQESGGGAHGIHQTGDRSEGQVVEGQYLEKSGRGEGTKGRGNSDTRVIH